MKKFVFAIAFMMLLSNIFYGCSGTKTNKSDKEEVSTDLFNNSNSNELGSVSFGVDIEKLDGADSESLDDNVVYKYSGEELVIPYYMIGQVEDLISKFGLMVFVDGVPQPYKIQKSQGDISEDSIIHNFALGYKEEERFNIVFNPVTGKKGDRLGISFAGMLSPDYMPESVEKFNSYGAYHSVTSNIPMTIEYETSAKDLNEFKAFDDIKYEAIPQEILDFYAQSTASDPRDYFDMQVITEMLTDSGKENLLHFKKNDKLKIKFRIYGGVETNYRTTIYINHKPVKVGDCDYVEVKTKKGNMAVAEVEIDTSKFNELNTIYAISLPYGKDYVNDSGYPFKSDSILLAED